jgi:hypothetical protein
MKKLHVERFRDFHAYHQLLSAAEMALESAEKEERGFYYHQMIAITFSALALESLVNSFGQYFIDEWNDYESARPIAKLRTLCTHLKIDLNLDEEPWSHVKGHISFRNNIAHAKPEYIKFDGEMTEQQFEKIRFYPPESKIEKRISLGYAQTSVRAIDEIKDILCDKVPDGDWGNLLGDGRHGSSKLITD